MSEKITRVMPTSAQTRAVSSAIRDMLAGYPYLGSLASSDMVRYHVVTGGDIPVAATDGPNVFVNGDKGGFFDYSYREQIFILGHETLHRAREDVSMMHVYRSQQFVPVPKSAKAPDGTLDFKEEVAQRALDCIINNALVEDRIGDKPANAQMHPKITWQTPFGEAYEILYREDEQQGGGSGQGGGTGQPGQGASDVLQPGQGGDPDSEGMGDDSPSQENPTQAAQKLAQQHGEMGVAIRRAQNMARSIGQGSSITEMMLDLANAPQVDWRQYISGFLSRSAGNSAYDFSRPQRKPLLLEEPYFVPSRGGFGVNHLVVVMDTSGSIGIPQQRVFLGATASAVSDLRPKEFTIIFCDSRIQRVDQEVDVDQGFGNYNIPKGGGTSFIPPFEWIEANLAEKPDGVIYLTDLYGPAPTQAPGYPVLWACITDEKGPWGETVHVPISDLRDDS